MIPLIDWSKVLIRCSCIHKVMTNGRGAVLTEKQAELLSVLEAKTSRTDKQDIEYTSLLAKKNAPPSLGDTAVSYLREVYVKERYGKETLGGSERSKYTVKGRTVEDESIMMLSRLDDKDYVKNTVRFTNDFLTGEPDIIVKEEDIARKIIDTKNSWDYVSLLSQIGMDLNPAYSAQQQGYMALTGATEAEVTYCLVNMPEEQIAAEKKRIFYQMNPVTEEAPEYLRAIQKVEDAWTFDEIPIQERVVRFPIQRDNVFIEKVYARVKMCREFLADFEQIHLGISYKK